MSKPARAPATAATHPIQVVTRRTGLSADVIRAWEKRYGVVAPVRSASGRRLYSDADVERLRLLARATLSGRTIGQVATLPPAMLAALAVPGGAGVPGEDGGTVRPPSDTPTAQATASAHAAARGHLDASLAAIVRFDGVALDLLLRRATVALSAEAFLDALVVPLTERVAALVGEGGLQPAHRHLAHAVLRRVLDHVTATATAPLPSRNLVVTTPSGQAHELGALLAAAASAAEGWRVTYLGPGLPAEDIGETVARTDARAVVLGLGAEPGGRALPRELRRLRTLLPSDVAILVEGAAADGQRAVLAEVHAAVLHDLGALRAQLRALGDGDAPGLPRPDRRASTVRRAPGRAAAPGDVAADD